MQIAQLEQITEKRKVRHHLQRQLSRSSDSIDKADSETSAARPFALSAPRFHFKMSTTDSDTDLVAASGSRMDTTSVDEATFTKDTKRQAGPFAEDGSDFVIPSQKRRRNVKKGSQVKTVIDTSNRYEPLQNTTVDNVPNVNVDAPDQPEVRVKQSPIVIHGTIERQQNFIGLIESITRDFMLQHNTAAQRFSIITFNKQIKNAIINALRVRFVKFHTFADKEDRKNTFVLKGLQGEWSLEDIQATLLQKGIKVSSINKMKNVRYSTYVISTARDVTLNMLNEKARCILYTRVTYELYKNKRQISQCHRCQEWGHVASNCYDKPACLKCAQEHSTHECTKPRDTPAKCFNCDGDPPANSITCPEYLKRVEAIEQRRARTRQTTEAPRRLQPAPPPTKNAWHERTRQAEQTRRTTTNSFSPTDDFSAKMNTLTEVINEMNSLIDIDRHIRELKQLNTDLRNCKNEWEKSLALQALMRRLNGTH